ncbi:polysaccharide deacetylase family protein [Clostridium folliculivorans]|uniref:NodB homology domain-containing protein n=1 Tax=Clostridium folliculivorans TaxID=2886038 RepID=A0A9W5Y624_9CLOT|nr:polysaccharide deacetylase family protein [Clostridium folliculivorans]GKU27311.1 hypothetical protein CFOLD11_41380 [Clostridium folliculivorans]GKU32162.1 hypothetical protein CFB3_42700 [Clostridium folliculivorans]
MKKKKRYNKTKSLMGRVRAVFFCVLILISSIVITNRYTQSGLEKTKVVQASSEIKQENRSENLINMVYESSSNNSVLDMNSKNNNIKKENDGEVINSVDQDSNSFDSEKIQNFLTKNIRIEDNKKIAFLTFDDGPSTTVTPKILNTLKENNVKATFFIVGKQLEETPEAKNILLETYKQGHVIANHTYSHNYSKLYPHGRVDVNDFMAEVEQNNNILKSVLGENFRSRVIRFPGGHASWKGVAEIDKKLEDKSYKYIDWNALIGDSEGGPKTKEQLIKRYHQTFVGQEKVVLLMHDTYGKQSTAEALPYIISDLKNKGYEFRTLR